MLTFTTDQLKQIVKDASPGDSTVASAVDKFDSFLDFKDLEGSVREDVEFLKSHPLILKDTPVTGWIYDVKSGKVSFPCLLGEERVDDQDSTDSACCVVDLPESRCSEPCTIMRYP